MHFIRPFSTCVVFLLLKMAPSPVLSCNSIGKNAGATAAKEISQAAVRSSEELRKALNEASDKLTRAMEKGIDATREVVKELAGSITELAKSVSIKIDSGDLKDAGKAATENLRDAVAELSRNWQLSIKSEDLQSVGKDAAIALSEALQNIEIKLKLYIRLEADDNIVRSIMYISIAVGIAFSVLFVAIVVSLKSCRKCTVALFTVCVEGCRNRDSTPPSLSTFTDNATNINSNRHDQEDPTKLLDDCDYMEGGRSKVHKGNFDKKKTRNSLASSEYNWKKFTKLVDFWKHPDPEIAANRNNF